MRATKKTAVVTGAAHKVGRAIAEQLLAHDYHVILHANTSALELKTWVLAHEKSSNVDIIEADLSSEAGQEHLVAETKKLTNTLDLLVNNASAFSPKPFNSIARKEYQRMLSINLEAPFFITQGLLPQLLLGTYPSVINIIDAMWQRPLPGFSHYAISKAGLAIMTKTLAVELSPKIRVNAVAPGALKFQPFFSQQEQNEFINRIPQGQLGTFLDIAKAALFLHEQAPYAVGEILVIDGGRSIA